PAGTHPRHPRPPREAGPLRRRRLALGEPGTREMPGPGALCHNPDTPTPGPRGPGSGAPMRHRSPVLPAALALAFVFAGTRVARAEESDEEVMKKIKEQMEKILTLMK